MTILYFGWILAATMFGIIVGISLAVFVCNELVVEKDKIIFKYREKILELQNTISLLKK